MLYLDGRSNNVQGRFLVTPGRAYSNLISTHAAQQRLTFFNFFLVRWLWTILDWQVLSFFSSTVMERAGTEPRSSCSTSYHSYLLTPLLHKLPLLPLDTIALQATTLTTWHHCSASYHSYLLTPLLPTLPLIPLDFIAPQATTLTTWCHSSSGKRKTRNGVGKTNWMNALKSVNIFFLQNIV